MKFATQAIGFMLSVGFAQAGVVDNLARFESDLEPRHSSILPKDPSGDLAKLFGNAEDRDKFFVNHFGSDIVHMERAASDLPSPMEDFSLKQLFEHNDITRRQWGSSDNVDKTKVSFEMYEEYIRGGGSSVASVFSDPNFLPFKRAIEESLAMPVSMNVYHSGPDGVALKPHTDRYDVLVLHLEGEKVWEICIPVDAEPEDYEGTLSAADVADIKEVSMENVKGCTEHEGESRSAMTCSNTTMAPGDVLYLPKGIVHSATTAPGFSSTTHVTVGLIRDNLRYGDFLTTFLATNADELSTKLTEDSAPEETMYVFLQLIVQEAIKQNAEGFGLGLRRMMPAWVWNYYELCTPLEGPACDKEKHDEARNFLSNALLTMLDGVKAETLNRIYKAEDTNDKDSDARIHLFGKSAWLVELAVESSIDSLKQVNLLEAGIHKHLAMIHSVRTREATKTRKERVDQPKTMKGIEEEAGRTITHSTHSLIKELNTGKYPEYNELKKVMEADVVDEVDLFNAQRALGDSAVCTFACDAAEAVCDLVCDAISLGADVCKVACDVIFTVCAEPLKLASCDGTCFSSCDTGCIFGCDAGWCTSSCDSGCIWGCDSWSGGSCDSGCTGSCDGSCVGESCDTGCTGSCDSSCISSCDSYVAAADPCFSFRTSCYSDCEAAESLANDCRDFCETDLNSCNVMCGFIDMTLDAIASDVVGAISDAISAVTSAIQTVVDALNDALDMIGTIAQKAIDAFDEIDAGATASSVGTSAADLATTVLDIIIGVIAVPLSPLCSILAWIDWVGMAGVSIGMGATLTYLPLQPTVSASIGLFSEDELLTSDKALIIEACFGLQIAFPSTTPPFSVDFDITYGITFEDTMTYEDAALWGSDVTAGVDLGQQISISTNFLAYFGFPVSLGGSVGWNLLDDSNNYINPFTSVPSAASFSVGTGSDVYNPKELISVEYAVCAAFGRVSPSLITRQLEEEGSVTISGKEYTSVEQLHELENRGRRNLHRKLGNAVSDAAKANNKGVGNGGKNAWNNYKHGQKPKQRRKSGFKPSNNKLETGEEHKAGHGPFDRFEVDDADPAKIPTSAEIDHDNVQTIVDNYNLHFKAEMGGKTFEEVATALDPVQAELLYEKIGGHWNSIEGEIIGLN